MPLSIGSLSNTRIGACRFKELNGGFIVTNEVGEYVYLDKDSFQLFIKGIPDKRDPSQYLELQQKGFLKEYPCAEELSRKFFQKNEFLFTGPSLHIVVLTLRCDHSCVYCQSGAKGLSAPFLDMSVETAKKVVDTIFSTSSPSIMIEFQGGEPLANWEVLQFVVKYARKKNISAKKKIGFSLVTNLSLLSVERMRFLLKNRVGICTSLDGPQNLHDKARIGRGGSSYRRATQWIRRLQNEIKGRKGYALKINALSTVTKYSIPYMKEIIDEYVRLDLDEIHLRPVMPFGIDNRIWRRIKFKTDEFLRFYRSAIEYILILNKKGVSFSERTAKIFLTKILKLRDPNFLDIRSPCGAGIGQIAYNYDGGVFTCDEGRMLAVRGNMMFRLGDVWANTYSELVNNEVVKSVCVASCLDNLVRCSDCAYKPYCGVCPIYNYVTEGNIFSAYPANERCRMQMGILDILFEFLRVPDIKKEFLKWMK